MERLERMYEQMYDRANSFYRSLGDEQTHQLWLGEELPHYFFVFLLRYCTLMYALRAVKAYEVAECD